MWPHLPQGHISTVYFPHEQLLACACALDLTNTDTFICVWFTSITSSVEDGEKELCVCLEQSIGHIGKCLGRDIQRYVREWCVIIVCVRMI